MITLYKNNPSLLRVISLILLVSIGLIGLTACKTSGLANSTTNVNNSSQAIADTRSTSPDNSGSTATYSDTAISTTTENNKGQPQDNKITYNDQIEVEESIKAFGNAVEIGDYNTAEEYCTPDFKDYMVNLTSGKGAVTDTFSMAIVGGLPIKLISVKGYYDEEEEGLNFNITKDKPTIHFLISFEIHKSNGEKESVEGYTQGVKDIDGKWHIEGFASGR